MAKDELRRRLKQERRAVPEALREEWDQALCEHLTGWEVYQQAKRCMTYLAFAWEINTWPLVKRMWKDGKEVYVPVTRPGRRLVPLLFGPDTKLAKAPFGMEEPVDSPELHPGELDLVIVPGLAFSPEGYRIGFGGGYYDRFLPQAGGVSVGVCYSQFIQPLPVEPWDVPVEYLCTELGIRRKQFPSEEITP